ncbi:MAG: glutathione peroxidase, partial [Candidatus Neomarinimicrobiota bacterium]|nr:glutathione peroxidase [Candidatus Neomarinimicrobiota bacterium]
MLMKIMITVPIFVMFLWSFNNSSNNPEKRIQPITSIYDHKVKLLNNEEIDWDDYRGKKILIVNVASNCGYTNQYNDLQELYETHGDVVEI